MLVTDKQYYMDKAYVGKLDLMIKRMKGTDDNVLPIDGDEGQGKTELAIGTCYYVSYMTGRPYNINNVFFNLDEGIKFASETKDQIIHFDEGALGLLRTQWWNKTQQKFLQLVMVARKKRHFIVICIPKFHRLPQYLMEERAIGLVHVYSRKNLQKGRFCYFTKGAKDSLFQDWERKKIKNYRKYYVIHGSFVKAMDKVFTKEDCQEYDNKKDRAIMSISEEKKPGVSKAIRNEIEIEIKSNIAKSLKEIFPDINLTKLSEVLKVSRRQFSRYLDSNNLENQKNPENLVGSATGH